MDRHNQMMFGFGNLLFVEVDISLVQYKSCLAVHFLEISAG